MGSPLKPGRPVLTQGRLSTLEGQWPISAQTPHRTRCCGSEYTSRATHCQDLAQTMGCAPRRRVDDVPSRPAINAGRKSFTGWCCAPPATRDTPRTSCNRCSCPPGTSTFAFDPARGSLAARSAGITRHRVADHWAALKREERTHAGVAHGSPDRVLPAETGGVLDRMLIAEELTQLGGPARLIMEPRCVRRTRAAL